MSLLRTSLAALAGAAALTGVGLTSAAAIPLAPLSAGTDTGIENVRLVCNRWGRCWNTYVRQYDYAPNYAYGYYGGPTYYRAPYYNGYYGPGVGVSVGPFGFGIW